MPESNSKVLISCAVIGLVGTIGAALISNWDKFSPVPKPAPLAEAILDISGVWQDAGAPSNTTRITQHGEKLELARSGILPTGVRCESSGSGELRGLSVATKYYTRYQNGLTSSGDCVGQVSPNGMIINCTDSILKAFSISLFRQ
ncbi:MAG: hypothetical protein ACREC0_06220 [Methylocella sp.]